MLLSDIFFFSELDSLCGTVVRVLGTGQTMEKILERLIEQVNSNSIDILKKLVQV